MEAREGLAAARPRVAPPRGLPARPLRAADQGPFDWLVPFIPPFLRVNRATREQIWTAISRAASPEALTEAAQRVVAFLQTHGTIFARWGIITIVWVMGLRWMQANAHELVTAYVIVSALVALAIHVFTGETTVATDLDGEKLSAYSVFNKGGRRMMGSLSAEQFENEIRHRGPAPHMGDAIAQVRREDTISDDEDDDPDLLEALRQSLEEKKREERRMRRTQRRR